MTRQVLHFLPWALPTPHIETDLELIQRELDAGSTVHVLTCSAAVPHCGQVKDIGLSTCLACVARRREGLAALNTGQGRLFVHRAIVLGRAERSALAALPPRFASLAELEALRFEDYDVGLAVVSSLVTLLRDPAPDVAEHAERIRGMVLSGCAVHLSTRAWIRRLRPGQAFVFNGRFVIHRAFFRACEVEGVLCTTHDRGATLEQFELFPGVLPHSREFADRRIKALWAAAPLEEARAVGARFYEDRARGIVYNYHSFTRNQKQDLLPTPWRADRLKIAVFLSSEDEFVAIGPEWRNPLYGDQWRGLFSIAHDLRGDDRVHIYVRCHPNSQHVTDANFQQLARLEGELPNLEVIWPTSRVSTYQLLRSADRVVSFGSTVGIEATYWRKPSILAGPSFYEGLAATYQPRDHAELLRLLFAEELPPLDLDEALKFGFEQSTFGTRFLHFEPTGVSTGRFRGRELRGHIVAERIAARVRRVPALAWLTRKLAHAARRLQFNGALAAQGRHGPG